MSKKLTERRKRWKFLPFPFELRVIITNDVHESFSKHFPKLPKRSPSCAAAAVSSAETTTIVLENGAPLSHIVHEVTHAVASFQEYIGEQQKEEFVAYYTGWCSEAIIRFVLDKPLDKKKKLRYTKKVKATQTHAIVSST